MENTQIKAAFFVSGRPYLFYFKIDQPNRIRSLGWLVPSPPTETGLPTTAAVTDCHILSSSSNLSLLSRTAWKYCTRFSSSPSRHTVSSGRHTLRICQIQYGLSPHDLLCSDTANYFWQTSCHDCYFLQSLKGKITF